MQIIKTTTSDKLEFSALYSKASNAKGIIIHIHGMAGDMYLNSYYSVMHKEYPQAGFSFLSVETRGTHSISEFIQDGKVINIGNAYEIFEECVYDIEAWVQKAKEAGYTNIWLQSHSLGTSKTAYFSSQKGHQAGINGQIWLSPSDMIGLVHDPVGQKDHDVLYPEAKKLVSEGKAQILLSKPLWDSVVLSAGTYLNLFDDKASTAIFNYKRPDLGWEVVNNIDVPVLAITGTKDDGITPVMEPHEAMKLLKKELKHSSKVKTVVYEGAEHGFEGFEKNIASDVLEFMAKQHG